MASVQSDEIARVQRAGSSSLATSYGAGAAMREHVVVRLMSDEGLSGVGEASPLKHFTGESGSIICTALGEDLLPAVRGLDPLDIVLAHQRMDAALPGNSSAKAAVDMALYDLAARTADLPLHRLLGGAVRHRVPITRPLGILPVEDAVAEALRHVQAGHRTLKLKVGIDVNADIARVRAVREAVGADVAIRIDANQGYDLATAMRFVAALRDARIEYFEQLLAAPDLRGLAQLRCIGARVAVDESLHSPADALRIVEAGAADVFVIKLIKTCGLWPALQIAAIGAAAGVGCVVVSPYDMQFGAAHALHLAAALPNLAGACELTVFASQASMATTSHRVIDGAIEMGLSVGCGVDAIAEWPELDLAARSAPKAHLA
ncbi:hypothetical protein M5C99_15980 [Acidovorax sp. NCPPB 2350]|nr:hypothetical protein M5C99_15980 [Acidovorax sp. NCPPB 2350]